MQIPKLPIILNLPFAQHDRDTSRNNNIIVTNTRTTIKKNQARKQYWLCDQDTVVKDAPNSVLH
jgi:glutamate racemase